MNEKAAIKILEKVKAVFDEQGIEFWLNYGTLLGAVRNGKFIDWDTDIDLATWCYNPKIVKKASKKLYDEGFETELYPEKLVIDGGKHDGPHIDVNFYHANDNEIVVTDAVKVSNYMGRILYYLFLRGLTSKYSSPKRNSWKKIIRISHNFLTNIPYIFKKPLYKITYFIFRKTGSFYFRIAIPSKYFKKLSKMSFYGIELRVPWEKENYLRYIYGNSWQTPMKQSGSWSLYKGICNKIQVKCPKCNQFAVIENPHKEDEKKPIKDIKIKCEKCNYEWDETVFIKGSILKNISDKIKKE